MKGAFSLLELIFVLSILSVSFFIVKIKYINNDLNLLTKSLVLNLKELRYQALIDNKYSFEEKWFKKLWSIRFLNCNKSVGGIYYMIYSDSNMKGHINKSETLKDPISLKHLYSSSKCETSSNNSSSVLLSKTYNIEALNLSCNKTKSLGQLSFSNKGEVYASLSSYESKNIIKKDCTLELIHKNGQKKTIIISNKTGYISIK